MPFHVCGLLYVNIRGCRKGSRFQEADNGQNKIQNRIQKEIPIRARLRAGTEVEGRKSKEPALMEAEPPWPRVVWKRLPDAARSQKKCSHPLCSWQQCELKLYTIFWAENPVFLAVWEERDPDRREALMNEIDVTLATNHITITQFCDQKNRAYKFDEDPDAPCKSWLRSRRRLTGKLFPWAKPTFEVVYEHKGCLQAGNSIPIVVGGDALITDVYYRRCDGQYRNICGQALKGGAGQQIFTKAPQDFVPYHLARSFCPFFASNLHTWTQEIAWKQDVRRPLGDGSAQVEQRDSEPLPEGSLMKEIGSSGKETMCRAKEGAEAEKDEEEDSVSRYRRVDGRKGREGSERDGREVVSRRGRRSAREREKEKAKGGGKERELAKDQDLERHNEQERGRSRGRGRTKEKEREEINLQERERKRKRARGRVRGRGGQQGGRSASAGGR